MISLKYRQTMSYRQGRLQMRLSGMIGVMTALHRRMAWQLIQGPSIVPICESAALPPQMISAMSGGEQPTSELTSFRASRALAQWDVTTLPERYIN
jgi:hypothetical protein